MSTLGITIAVIVALVVLVVIVLAAGWWLNSKHEPGHRRRWGK